MKRSLLILLLFLFMLTTFAQKPYTVTGVFKSKYKGKVYLWHGMERDSVYSNDGKFVFKGKVGIPENSFVNVESKLQQGITPFYIEGGNISLEVDTFTTIVYTSKGARKSLDVNAKLDKQSETDKLIDSVSKLMAERIKEVQDTELKNIEIRKIVLNFLLSKPNTIASTVILERNTRSFSKEQVKEFYQNLSPEIKISQSGKNILGSTIKQLPMVIGEKIPDFEQSDIKGEKVSIQSLRGNYVLIDFWASWCVPCRKENPAVVAAYKKFKDKGFGILSVSLDDKKQNWLHAIKEDKLNWLHVSDLNGWNNEVAKRFNIRSIPDNILIDREGKILARSLRGDDLAKKLQEIFSKEAEK
jgi:peroxiredoxin